jgi:hypothetical protein
VGREKGGGGRGRDPALGDGEERPHAAVEPVPHLKVRRDGREAVEALRENSHEGSHKKSNRGGRVERESEEERESEVGGSDCDAKIKENAREKRIGQSDGGTRYTSETGSCFGKNRGHSLRVKKKACSTRIHRGGSFS